MSNHPQKSGSLCSGMSGSLYSGIGGSLYAGILIKYEAIPFYNSLLRNEWFTLRFFVTFGEYINFIKLIFYFNHTHFDEYSC